MLPRKLFPMSRCAVRGLALRIQTALLLIVFLSILLAGAAFAGEFNRQFEFDAKKLSVSNRKGLGSAEGLIYGQDLTVVGNNIRIGQDLCRYR